MSRSRRLLATLMVALLALGLSSGDAWAKKNKKGKKKSEPTVQLTGIAAFDDVFSRVKEIDHRLSSAEQLLATARKDLNDALGLKRDTPLKTGLADLKSKANGKVKVVMKGKQPKLEPSDAVPQNVSNALDAVNRMTDGIVQSLDDLSGIPAEAKSLIAETKSFPDKLKTELKADPLSGIMKGPKVLKTLKGNATVTAGLPDRSTKVVKRMNNMVTLVRGEFPVGGGGGASPGTDAEAPERPGAGERTGGRRGTR